MEYRWASEAVQLGGVGSALGSLGMWTGAYHEDGDPIGTPVRTFTESFAHNHARRSDLAVEGGLVRTRRDAAAEPVYAGVRCPAGPGIARMSDGDFLSIFRSSVDTNTRVLHSKII